MKNKLILIQNDVFDISERVKNLDRQYQIFYNRGTSRYEVHHSKCFPTLQVVLPYESLDCRALDYLAKTKISNIDAIMQEIETNNQQVEKHNQNQLLENGYEALESYLLKNT